MMIHIYRSLPVPEADSLLHVMIECEANGACRLTSASVTFYTDIPLFPHNYPWQAGYCTISQLLCGT